MTLSSFNQSSFCMVSLKSFFCSNVSTSSSAAAFFPFFPLFPAFPPFDDALWKVANAM
jgi:hypothetical protein